MEPIKLSDGVYNVGVIDWNVRDFHGYSTDLGTTYNSFLIVDEKTVLIDTVRKEFTDELIDNIALVIDPKKIDFVIGPLLKNKVEEFLPLVPKTPVLSLNSFANVNRTQPSEIETQAIAWHYAFPLSPEHEAQQASQLIQFMAQFSHVHISNNN